MDSEKRKKVVLYSILAFVVFLYLYLEVFKASPKDREPANTQETISLKKSYNLQQLEKITDRVLSYRSSIPKYKPTRFDPFGGYDLLKLTDASVKSQVQENKAPIQTQLRLLGIIWDDTKPYALVAHANGKSYDVTKDSIVEGEKIITVNQDSIVTERDGVRFELTDSGSKRLQ